MRNKNLVFFVIVWSTISQLSAQTIISYDQILLERVRHAATYIMGDFPKSINYLKFAESPRTWKATIEEGDESPYIQARTVFQIIYDKGFIMIDAGMDEKVHSFFGRGKKEPYFQSKADTINKALEQASLILITHEHADHISGVIRNKDKNIANKTILTQTMVETLKNKPQMPLIKLSENESREFIIADFTEILPVSPGVVLIKAPGHTQGEIMIYVRLQNEQEYIFTGDVSWSYKGIVEKKLKPENQIKRIGEDPYLIKQEIEWLNMLITKTTIDLIVSHDDFLLKQMEKENRIKNGFILYEN